MPKKKTKKQYKKNKNKNKREVEGYYIDEKGIKILYRPKYKGLSI
jgi:hypothetical protein